MNDPLGLITGPSAPGSLAAGKLADSKPAGADFGTVLKAEMAQVNELQEAAQVAAEDFAAGRRDDIESVLFAARKADTAFKMLLQVRNKVLEAYEEVKQLRI
ncbi:MAG: flagellar hook-basal body complex protein FliE [Phycisphaerales bacterium]|nr:flagellar hook-basal body complex protein FliE [Phycisphaerales bacterium]|tara:strand:+ start:6511 stop:6816 length:306 start_codon:yes stop_codon:yes gene_type:complete